VDALASS